MLFKVCEYVRGKLQIQIILNLVNWFVFGLSIYPSNTDKQINLLKYIT